MKVFPENKTVLCERLIGSKSQAEVNGILAEHDRLPVYRVVMVADGIRFWKIGDMVICDSTGTRLNVPGQGVRYLFKEENIACRILDIQKGNENHGQ